MRHYRIVNSVFALTVAALLPATGAAAPFGATVKQLLDSGPTNEKKNLVIIGDGYQSAEQDAYNAYVKDRVLDNLFTEGPLWEDMNAFNIFRINVDSVDSGVTQVRSPITENMTPTPAPGSGDRNFTFSAVSTLPMINKVVITDPSGLKIKDLAGIGTNPVPLGDASGVVSGSLDRTTGVATLSYTVGNAPPAGTFSITYGAITTAKDTVLDYRYSGDWDRCYFDDGPKTYKNVMDILKDLVPDWNFYVVVLNETSGGGGCGWAGTKQVLTMKESWQTFAHESGHMVGGLCDEYFDPGPYTDPEPGCVNATTNNSDRTTLKWKDFLDPATTFPNTPWVSPGMDEAESVGHFEGAKYKSTGIWRPAYEGRMRWNNHAFGPVSYTHIKENLDSLHEHNFAQTYIGDFNGDGRSDIVIHNANALELYLSDGTHTLPRWVQTLPLAGLGSFADNDKFLVGDFDGDGRDDLIVYNMVDFATPDFTLLHAEVSPKPGFTVKYRYVGTLPGWEMRPGDKFYVADFDADGKADLYVANTTLTDWSMGYLGMLRSTGTALEMKALYSDTLPGWDKMKPGDQFYVANVDGTGGKDLFVVNNTEWCAGYLMSLLSTGTALVEGPRYDQVLGNWANLMPGDKYVVADFEGRGNDGLYVFNGTDWSVPYLGVLRSSGTGQLDVPIMYQQSADGWGLMKPNDRFMAANVDGQGGTDLFVSNTLDWGGTRYLGRLISNAEGFTGSYQTNQIGKWTLANDDVFHVANFNGTTGGVSLDDLIVHIDPAGDEALGLLSNNGSALEGPVKYWKWIHHLFYHSTGYW
jgi:hypothetical protein